ncbi:uncharacterized protein [Euphorbia lathyris]|uniref:uncharacterized protein n=1 Tax=Euphorbia lathyris TaxID=212925 RepID=UPI003313D060
MVSNSVKRRTRAAARKAQAAMEALEQQLQKLTEHFNNRFEAAAEKAEKTQAQLTDIQTAQQNQLINLRLEQNQLRKIQMDSQESLEDKMRQILAKLSNSQPTNPGSLHTPSQGISSSQVITPQTYQVNRNPATYGDHQERGILGSGPPGSVNGDPATTSKAPYFNKLLPKCDLPSFDGTDVDLWISKCHKYFQLFKVAQEKKVELAGLYLQGKAERWYKNWIPTNPLVSWDGFIEEVEKRFRETEVDDIVQQIEQLRQETNVAAYQDQFEMIKLKMEKVHPTITESYYVSSFITGLKPEIRSSVRKSEPTCLYTAIKLAKYQETHLKDLMDAFKPKPKFRSPLTPKPWLPNNPSNTKYTPQPSSLNPSSSKPPDPKLPPSTTTLKRTPEACYKCGEKYFPGHQCTLKKLNAINAEDIPEEEMEGDSLEKSEAGKEIEDQEQITLSINALDGGISNGTLKLKGTLQQKPIMVLIDSGSTHSFLDQKLAKEAKLPLMKVAPAAVPVADGRQLMVHQKCNSCQWTMNHNRKLPKYNVTATLQCAGNRRTAMSNVKKVRGVGWDACAIGNDPIYKQRHPLYQALPQHRQANEATL